MRLAYRLYFPFSTIKPGIPGKCFLNPPFLHNLKKSNCKETLTSSSVNAKHLLRRADYVRSIITSGSILRAEVKHRHLGPLGLVLWDVFDKLEEEFLESVSLFFQSKVEILRVQVVQTVDHRAELG